MGACEEQQQVGDDNSRGVCGFMEAGVEAGFAARVLHTTVDAFGSLSVVRIITNDYDIDDASSKKKFKSLPNEVVVLRSGEKVKLPSGSACFALLYGKERTPLNKDEAIPGSVIAIPKLPDSVHTNDILLIPQASKQAGGGEELDIIGLETE